jgi:hypothetical protein
MAQTLALQTLDCQKAFEHLRDAATPPAVGQLETELGRFRLWANNIGAAKTGRSGLDYRLRDAKYLNDNVTALLKDLYQNLNDGTY